MKRLRCAETSCVHNQNGGCTAECIQVSAVRNLPSCDTYETFDVSKNTAVERFTGFGNGYIGDGIKTSRFAQTEFGEIEPEERGTRYKVSCTCSDCLRNCNYTCRAAWLEIGYPKSSDQVDIECKTYISNRMGSDNAVNISHSPN